MYELHMSMTIKIVRGLEGIRKDRALFLAMDSGFDLRSNPEDRKMPLPTFFRERIHKSQHRKALNT